MAREAPIFPQVVELLGITRGIQLTSNVSKEVNRWNILLIALSQRHSSESAMMIGQFVRIAPDALLPLQMRTRLRILKGLRTNTNATLGSWKWLRSIERLVISFPQPDLASCDKTHLNLGVRTQSCCASCGKVHVREPRGSFLP